jgi:hypothetical protein
VAAEEREEGYPDLVPIRARSQVVAGALGAAFCLVVVVVGVVAAEAWAAIWGAAGIGVCHLTGWTPHVVFGPEEMVVSNAFRTRIVRYDDVERITFNGHTWVHNRSLVLVCRTDGWVSVDAIRRHLLLALVGLDDQSVQMHAEVERRVQLAASRR